MKITISFLIIIVCIFVVVRCSNAELPHMVWPQTGTFLKAGVTTFQWSRDVDATSYQLWFSGTPGGNNLGWTLPVNGTYVDSPNLPSDGSMIYVTVKELIDGNWVNSPTNIFAYNTGSDDRVTIVSLILGLATALSFVVASTVRFP